MRRSWIGRPRVSTSGPGSAGARTASRTNAASASARDAARMSVSGMIVAMALAMMVAEGERALSPCGVSFAALIADARAIAMLPVYFSVDVVMDRIALDNRWVTEQWLPSAVEPVAEGRTAVQPPQCIA